MPADTPAGAGPYATWGDVPGGEQNVLTSLRNEWEALTGFTFAPDNTHLLRAANGHIMTLADFGKFMVTQLTGSSYFQKGRDASGRSQTVDPYPWAQYGLTKDEYVSASSIFGTEYKKVTGQDISPAALEQAFQNPRDPTGGLLTGSQYQQQLMSDANIQQTYGWVRYGLDYSAWTAQKLQARTGMGRDITDAEASTLLQYNVAAKGSNAAAIARQSGQQQSQQPAGAGGSVVR